MELITLLQIPVNEANADVILLFEAVCTILKYTRRCRAISDQAM